LLGLLGWWLFARRVSWRDRLLGTGAAVVVVIVALLAAHPSVGQVLVVRGLPIALTLLAVALLLTRSFSWSYRRWLLAACLALGLLPWAAFRVDGQRGSLGFDFSLRWQPTAEDRFLEDLQAQSPGDAGDASGPGSLERGALLGVPARWPGFRGPSRDGAVRDVVFGTDWEANPPRERWRHAVGPAWSSFAVAGGLAFTQEQRGEEEVTIAYSLQDGSEVWIHGSHERFEESQGGPGPRATPTYDDGRVYALGARGTLTALDAATGGVLWSRNLRDDVGAPLPQWGFSSSPLVEGRAVIVFAGATDGRSLVAYDRDAGAILWTAGEGQQSYSSPVPASIGGVSQVLMATDFGVQAFLPADGTLAWEYEWQIPGTPRIAMPVVLADNRSVMVPTGYGKGTRRVEVTADGSSAAAFATERVWESRFLKPYFNDAVCHEGHCYGFDGRIFTCIGADDGERRWKGGRYGNGQVALLPAMDLLLVITEQGEVVLVPADPSAHREIARMQALTGKTWNHPVVIDGLLLVRNDEEVACYELPPAS
jgi:outer membrane protein assembly factor BamB